MDQNEGIFFNLFRMKKVRKNNRVCSAMCSGTCLGAQTKRPKKKRPKGQKVPGTKHHKDKTSQGTKRPPLILKLSKTHFVLEHWPLYVI